MQNINDVTFDDALNYFGNSVGAMIVADQEADSYRSLVRRGIFQRVISENGTYEDLVRKLWFHYNSDGREITEAYNVFIPNMGKFVGKYSKRLKLLLDDIPHIVQMTILPVDESGHYLFLLDELDEHEKEEDEETQNKVSTIQNNIYVFTMVFDLVRDTTSSVSPTEISDEALNYQLSYSEWRNMIVNMIWEDEKALFLERSSPEYLKAHFKPGHVESFDLQMVNLDGIFQWVKLIFSRMETTNENDYRFVYMVQNIHETTMSMKATLKHYEELASRDSLTQLFNHGRIETELCNAIEQYRKNGQSVGLMIIDIDNFKAVNDKYGHAVGDTTLKHFAELIKQTLNGRNTAFGRWGGEEFAAVTYDTDEADLNKLAEALRSAIAEGEFEVVGSITCSIGGTLLRHEDVLESWFERADQAVYTAKTNGRNCVCVK